MTWSDCSAFHVWSGEPKLAIFELGRMTGTTWGSLLPVRWYSLYSLVYSMLVYCCATCSARLKMACVEQCPAQFGCIFRTHKYFSAIFSGTQGKMSETNWLYSPGYLASGPEPPPRYLLQPLTTHQPRKLATCHPLAVVVGPCPFLTPLPFCPQTYQRPLICLVIRLADIPSARRTVSSPAHRCALRCRPAAIGQWAIVVSWKWNSKDTFRNGTGYVKPYIREIWKLYFLSGILGCEILGCGVMGMNTKSAVKFCIEIRVKAKRDNRVLFSLSITLEMHWKFHCVRSSIVKNYMRKIYPSIARCAD